MSEIRVSCAPRSDGWRCAVTVSDAGGARSFEVDVTATELARFGTGAGDPIDLVRRSFEFLLEREPKESILSRFSLSTILRYFPEYEREIDRH